MGKTCSKTTEIHVAHRFSLRLAPALVVTAVTILFVAPKLTYASPGDLYVSDAGDGNAGSGNIYKFTVPERIRSTFAAGLNSPAGLAFDSAGNLFEADAGSGQIYKFTPGGIRSTFAAGLNRPVGLAFDSVGNLFEADAGSGHIYKFTPGGIRSTFASGLNNPFGLAFNSAGDLFEANSGNGEIFEFTPAGTRSTFASNLSLPVGLAFNSYGDLFEADSGTGHIFEFIPGRNQATFASGLSVPFGLAFDSAGNLFEVDKGTGQIFQFTPAGSKSAFANGLNEPTFIAFARPTPNPTPTVITYSATSVASFSATLNGTLNPHGSVTTVSFQYGTTTSYELGTTPIQSRTGNTVQNISANIVGLSANTTYHFRIEANNNGGTSHGIDRTFTTLSTTGPPVVATIPATSIASFSATLNGSLDPHGLTTMVYFQYGLTTSYELGTTLVQSQTGGNTFRNISANIVGLSANTTYHFRIRATNSVGTSNGNDRIFTTLSTTGPPVVATNPASSIASFLATLNGSLDPHGLTTMVYFRYGLTTSYELGTTLMQTQTGNTFRNISATIGGLSASTTYHFRIEANNNGGTSHGSDVTFTTLSTTGAPVVTTNSATQITSSSATLNGTLNPHGSVTTVSFQYGTTTSYELGTTPIQSRTGDMYLTISANIGGLSAGTIYHFRIVATNNGGTSHGIDRTFRTP